MIILESLDYRVATPTPYLVACSMYTELGFSRGAVLRRMELFSMCAVRVAGIYMSHTDTALATAAIAAALDCSDATDGERAQFAARWPDADGSIADLAMVLRGVHSMLVRAP